MSEDEIRLRLRPVKRRLEEVLLRTIPGYQISARFQLPSLLNARRLFGVGVEVGVYEGWFSEYLLNHWRGKRLIAIDPWRQWTAEYSDDCNLPQQHMDNLFEATVERLRRYGDRSDIWRLTSEEASARLSHESLDFVYIDAQHHESAVAEDLNLWFPKVRQGGMLAGHDYMDGVFPFGVFGVKSAVGRFVKENGLALYTTDESVSPSWYVFN